VRVREMMTLSRINPLLQALPELRCSHTSVQ
jgi:hypothetical protein